MLLDEIRFYINYLNSMYVGYAPMIRVTLVLVAVLIIFYIISWHRLIRINIMYNKREKRWRRLVENFEEKVAEVLYSPDSLTEHDIEEITGLDSSVARKKWQKEILTEFIIYIRDKHEKTSSDKPVNDSNLKELSEIFQLEDFWIKEFTSRSTTRRNKAIRKLSAFTRDSMVGALSGLLYEKDDGLRKMARSEYIKMEEFDTYRFMALDDFDTKFNRLDAIRLHDSLCTRSRFEPLPLFLQWCIRTNNMEYKTFLVKEIGFFNQRDSAPELLTMFRQSNDVNLRSEIVNTLGLFRYKDALPILTSDYSGSGVQVQNAILTAIKRIGSSDSLPFLQTLYDSTGNSERKEELQTIMAVCRENQSTRPGLENVTMGEHGRI